MPEKKTVERAKKAKREGKHGAKNAKPAIAIGLSKARRSGVALDAPKKGTAKKSTRKRAKRATSSGHSRAGANKRVSR